jgi:hypothetical protein
VRSVRNGDAGPVNAVTGRRQLEQELLAAYSEMDRARAR